MVQLSHPYTTTGKTTALTRWTFVSNVMSLLNILSRFVIAFFPRSKCLLISWLQSPSTVILKPKKIKYSHFTTETVKHMEVAQIEQAGNPAPFMTSHSTVLSNKYLKLPSLKGEVIHTFLLSTVSPGTSLVVQWLRSYFAMQGTTQVWSLVGELRLHMLLSN